MTTRIVLLVPDSPIREAGDLPQRLTGIRCRFPDLPITVASVGEAPPLADGDRVVVFAEATDHPAAAYRVFSSGRVLPIQGTAIGPEEYPDLDVHPFSRLGPRGQGELDYGCFHFFPYGYLYRLIGLGAVNPFGHRIVGDFRTLARRSADHKLITCFGGSAVWSICTTPEQSFPVILESLLNERADREGLSLRASVLNFGVPGAVVLNSMQHFLLYAADLRPDIVISHDGVNDLFYGCTSDPWLLREHGIVYQQQLEYWAAMLHDPGFKGDANLGGPVVSPTNVLPTQILKAYVRRKREFMTVCRGFGSRFVFGLQPFASSKAALSPLEQSRIGGSGQGQAIAYESEFRTVRALFDLLRPSLRSFGADLVVDFDREFGRFDQNDTVMADMVHLAPQGDRVLAERYAEDLWPLLTA